MANLIAEPRFWKKKSLLVKAEPAVGTDAVPTGLANWIEARNVNFTPMDIATADRQIEVPYFGNGGTLIVGKYAKLGFEVALAGPGAAGTAPKISPLLLAAGMAETLTADTSAVYNLVSAGIGAVTFYVNIDGVRHKMVGSRGNASLALSASGIPKIKFDFESVYVTPDEQPLPTVDKSGWPIEEGVTAATTLAATIGGVPLAWSDFNFALGNSLQRIDLPGPQIEVAIDDRKPTADVTVLAPGLAVFNPYALAEAGTVQTFTTTHGSSAGKKVQIDAKVRVVGVDYAQIKGMVAYKLKLEPFPVAGNDEFALTYL